MYRSSHQWCSLKRGTHLTLVSFHFASTFYTLYCECSLYYNSKHKHKKLCFVNARILESFYKKGEKMKKENEKVLPYSQNRKLGFKNLGKKSPRFPRLPSFRPGHDLYGSVETLQYSGEILWKGSIHVTSFSKEIFFIYFEHNRNSIES